MIRPPAIMAALARFGLPVGAAAAPLAKPIRSGWANRRECAPQGVHLELRLMEQESMEAPRLLQRALVGRQQKARIAANILALAGCPVKQVVYPNLAHLDVAIASRERIAGESRNNGSVGGECSIINPHIVVLKLDTPMWSKRPL
jgi:hypothetical protein